MGVMTCLGAADFYRCLHGAVAELAAQQERINRLNVFPVPDGDTGSNMCLTLEAALREAEGVYAPDVSLGRLVRAAARGSLWGARGNSGVILSQFLQGWADGLAHCREEATPEHVVDALDKAVATAYRAVMEPVEGTMLSVGKGAAQAARAALPSASGVGDVLRAALEGARAALEKTPTQLEVLRRAGVVDAGGAGLVAIMEGALRGATGQRTADRLAAREPVPAVAAASGTTAADAVPDAVSAGSADDGEDELTFKYCTEFLLKGRDLPAAELQRQLAELGDSVLVVGDGHVLKIHLHTNRPGKALEIAVDYGSLSAVQISNMEEQMAERAARDAAAMPAVQQRAVATVENTAVFDPQRVTAPMEDKLAVSVADERAVLAVEEPAALVAVAPGPGLADIFRSLGAGETVFGGQTMNPSVQQLADAIARVPGRHVIVLPNNKNVVLAAQHAAALVPDKTVRVVPSATVPQGVAAALAFRPVDPSAGDGGLDLLVGEMERAMAVIRSGEVTVAARDFEADGQQARAGDVIGLAGDALVAVGQDKNEVAYRLVEAMGGARAQLITVYYGAEVDETGAEHLAARLREAFPDAEVELYAGGQPHYPYLLSVE